MIQLKEVLRRMEHRDEHGRPVPFSLLAVTANEATGEGGELLQLDGAVLARLAGTTRKGQGKASQAAPAAGKQANEWSNQTRNIYLPESGQTRKVCIRLITRLNGETVVY